MSISSVDQRSEQSLGGAACISGSDRVCVFLIAAKKFACSCEYETSDAHDHTNYPRVMASSSSRLDSWDLVAVVCYFGAVLGIGLYVSRVPPPAVV